MRLLLILLLTLNLLQAKKIALLIGNSDYNFAPLANPLNDVDGIYQTLKEIGFDISRKDVLKNASQTQMQQALAKFSQRASSAEIALVYFSGHGMQVGNTNYMLPAKTHPQKPVDLYGLVNLDYFIQSASSAKYGIVLIDACRNNPLVKYFQSGRHKGDSTKKGLGQVTPKSGQVVIGFATRAGDTADDGYGSMSPYANALSQRLKTPNKDITKVLGLVALDVSAQHHEQKPIIQTNLAYDVCLYGQCGYSSLSTEQPKVKIVERIVYRDRPQEIIYTTKPKINTLYSDSTSQKTFFTITRTHPSGNINSSSNKIFLKKIIVKNNKIISENILKTIGTFTNKPNLYSMRYSEDNKPQNGYSRMSKYKNTEYSIFPDTYLYVAKTLGELSKQIKQEAELNKCTRYADNFSGGRLNRNDNFWVQFCPQNLFKEIN